MSETLLGVLIGGVLASLGSWIAIVIENNKWKRQTLIERLSAKRDRLEVNYRELLAPLDEAIRKNSYPIQLVNDLQYLFPDKVSELFFEMVRDPDQSEETRRGYYFRICQAMKGAIAELDDAIDRAVAGSNAVLRSSRPHSKEIQK